MLEAGVYVCLEGGLGNQLFMYAAGKALAYRTNTRLFMDINSGFQNDTRYRRRYSLGIFNVDFSHFAIDQFVNTRLARLINKIGPLRYRNMLLEKNVNSLRNIQVNKAIQIKGYWQSDDHFKDQWSLLSKDLKHKLLLSHESAKILDKIQSSKPSISIHFRRLDYRHTLSEEYYSKAIKHFGDIFEGAHFLIFADTHEAPVLEILSRISHTIVKTNNHQEDFVLMSSCSHHILANSTYSWWAAYLNKNDNKIVLNPREWGFKIKMPESWVSL